MENSAILPPKLTTSIIDGLPETKNLGGYFYLENIKYRNTYRHGEFSGLFASFSEPAANLTGGFNHRSNNLWVIPSSGNIYVGDVCLNNHKLLAGSFPDIFYYYKNGAAIKNTTIVWDTKGNKSFKPATITLKRDAPVLTVDSASISEISIRGFTIDLAPKVSNYDSVVVIIFGNYFSTPVLAQKHMSVVKQAVFDSLDFDGYTPGNYLSLGIYAYNYSYQIIEDRVYVCERSTKISQSVKLVP